MATYLEIFLIAGAVLYALYYYFTMHFDFWKHRAVPGPKPIPLFGNALGLMVGQLSPAELVTKLYQKYKGEPLVGIIVRRTPVLIVQDPDLIKNVLIKDFVKFSDRTFWRNEIVSRKNYLKIFQNKNTTCKLFARSAKEQDRNEVFNFIDFKKKKM